MDWPLLIPLAAITLGPLSWVANTWIRARHGYPVENIMSKHGGVSEARRFELLIGENTKLNGQVSRLEERIAVLERIATDPAERTAREIEALRGR
ncbi:hypothetical protein [uncultured Sphingomonas sp.]|uniref:hypothetical protein n=1 Tax=uncultured Sphingomonas sp. TaxID=158754 RepID=UPI0035C991F4